MFALVAVGVEIVYGVRGNVGIGVVLEYLKLVLGAHRV